MPRRRSNCPRPREPAPQPTSSPRAKAIQMQGGAMVPSAWVVQAQKVRRWFRAAVSRLFQQVDAIIAPATPCVAPLIGQKTFQLYGQNVPLRPHIGIYTQPISFIGLPV